MSRKRKQDYVPLTANSAKHAIEIPVKQVDEKSLESIEKPGKIDKERNVRGNNGYILIITEKPAAAAKIAYALGNPKKLVESGVSYYELKKDDKKILVACAVGHLFSLAQKEDAKKSGWPVFDIEWKPNFQVRKNDWSKKYYNVLARLCRNAGSFLLAMDYDIEGEVIGWNILRFICKEKDAKRMRFSSLTKRELEQAYEKPEETINWGQAIAGETRHYLDWIYGINLSRALMSAIKKAGNFRIMSIGRVQGPALHLVVERERAIQKFKSTPYWQVFLLVSNSHKIEVKYVKDIIKKFELEKFKKLEGRKAIAETKKTEQEIMPPVPFDLTTLQTEAYRFYKIKPSRVLQIAQQLYLAGLISYPRTSSQKIPESIQPLNIIKKLSNKFPFTKCAKRKKAVEGKKSDPAHPSIFPTGEFGDLLSEEKRIYELIVRRFVSCFCENAIIENKMINVKIDDLKFNVKGIKIKEKGWMNVYRALLKDKELPDLDGEVTIEKVKIEKKMTKPPKRYTPASLVSELAKRSLGTKATRSSIIETLYNRAYIRDESIRATALGISLISSLEKYSPIIIDEKLTRKFEQQMGIIQTAKKNLVEKEEKIINNAKRTIIKISNGFKKNEENIGKELIKANQDLRKEEEEANKLNKCPVCKKGYLRIIYSKKTRRYFVACSAYPNCKTTFSLPPNALIKKSGQVCECGFVRLMLIKKGKRPWIFCFNPKCMGKDGKA